MRLWVLAAACLAASCSSEPEAFETAQAAVKEMLVDPESAQFDNLRVLENGTVCGFVNAKNGFGGYGGKKPFYHLSEDAMLDDSINTLGRTFVASEEYYLGLVDRVCSIGEGQIDPVDPRSSANVSNQAQAAVERATEAAARADRAAAEAMESASR